MFGGPGNPGQCLQDMLSVFYGIVSSSDLMAPFLKLHFSKTEGLDLMSPKGFPPEGDRNKAGVSWIHVFFEKWE